MDERHVRGIFFFKDILHLINRNLTTRRDAQNIAILSQKRSIGYPPLSWRPKVYQKYYEAVTAVPRKLTDEERSLLRRAARSIWEPLQGSEDFYKVVARCQRNEKVSLSGSADLLSTKKEGGKVNSAFRILQERLPVTKLNLETGEDIGIQITSDQVRSGEVSIGEALFAISLRRFREARLNGIKSDPILFTVQPKALPDQAKLRVATKAHPEHAFLLQPLAQITKAALKRLESARAGMSKQHHMYEFYKRILPEMVTRVQMQDKPLEGESSFYFEDWSTATDNESREAAHLCIMEAGQVLGVPRFYLEIAAWALTAPRINVISNKEKDLTCPNQFVSTSGVLMGDPVTKTTLQLSHIVSLAAAREVLWGLAEISKVPNFVRAGNPSKESPAEFTSRALYGSKGAWMKAKKEKRLETSHFSTSGAVPLWFPLIARNNRGDTEGFRRDVIEQMMAYQNAVDKTRDAQGRPRLVDKEELARLSPRVKSDSGDYL